MSKLSLVDVTKHLVAVNELVAVGWVVSLLPLACTAAVVEQRLRELLLGIWRDSWDPSAEEEA